MASAVEAQRSFERLFRAHHAAVLAYVRRRAPAERVDDAVAETFLIAWESLTPAQAAGAIGLFPVIGGRVRKLYPGRRASMFRRT